MSVILEILDIHGYVYKIDAIYNFLGFRMIYLNIGEMCSGVTWKVQYLLHTAENFKIY